MALHVKIHGGVRKAKRIAKRLGLDVKACSHLPQRFARITDFRTPVGRTSSCSVADTDEANRIVRKEFMKGESSKIFDFKNK
jgi:hypothetical protein